jgi:hypothetical protein
MPTEIVTSDVEQVAQAIAAAWLPGSRLEWQHMTPNMKDYARREARAALEKAREIGWRKVAA